MLSANRQFQQDYFSLLCREMLPPGRMAGYEQTPFLAGEWHGHPSSWIECQFWDWEHSRPCFRTIFWNEVVWDFDHKLWSHNWSSGMRLINVLRRHQIPHTIWPSGGKGIHIHVLLDADRRGADWVQVRGEVFNRISLEAGVSADPQKVYWQDTSTGSLLRIEGGMRVLHGGVVAGVPDLTLWDMQQDGYVTSYKFWSSHVPRDRRLVTEAWRVNYPAVARTWRVPQAWIPEPEETLAAVPYSDRPVPEVLKKLIDALQNGWDVNDFGRFAIASHLVARGWTIDEMVPIYSHAPDFSETITRGRLGALIAKRDAIHPPGVRSILQRCSEVPGLGDLV